MTKQPEIARNSLVNSNEEPDLAKPPRPAEVYNAVLNEGEVELSRGFPALWWPGVSVSASECDRNKLQL